MPTLLKFAEFSPSSTQSTDCLVIVGRKLRLLSEPLQSCLPASVRDNLSVMLEKITGGDAGQATSTWLPASTLPSRFVACVLPEPCSRHNSRARPHAITTLVRDATPDVPLVQVVVALEHADDAVAAACALARSFPSFQKKSPSEGASERTVTVSFVPAEGVVAAVELERAQTAALVVRHAASLVDTPTSELNTDTLVDEALRVGKSVGAKVTLIRGDELRAKGFGGLWNVGRAAKHGPAFVVLSHEPKGASKSVVWIGKGIVYDTGGLSLKDKDFMLGMKGDMGGAAAVLGAFQAAVQLGFKERLHAVLCIAENAIGPEAVRPDDIIQLYSGKTVEINNTDAEGRLVLGDGIGYAVEKLDPHVIVDVATLTGAQKVATGGRHAGIVSNREEWEQKAVRAGQLSGDLVHPLPYVPEFFRSEFKSEMADMKNSVKDRTNAPSSCAAQFLADQMGKSDIPWLHVDIAGPSGMGERATGFGIALLLELFRDAMR